MSPEENSEVTESDAPASEPKPVNKKEAKALKAVADEASDKKEAKVAAAKKLRDEQLAKNAARLAAMPVQAKSGRRISKADALYSRCVAAVARGDEVLLRAIGGQNTVVDIDNP